MTHGMQRILAAVNKPGIRKAPPALGETRQGIVNMVQHAQRGLAKGTGREGHARSTGLPEMAAADNQLREVQQARDENKS